MPDLLRNEPGAKPSTEPPKIKTGDKATPAYWGEKLGLPFVKNAMRHNAIALDVEMTESEFRAAYDKWANRIAYEIAPPATSAGGGEK